MWSLRQAVFPVAGGDAGLPVELAILESYGRRRAGAVACGVRAVSAISNVVCYLECCLLWIVGTLLLVIISLDPIRDRGSDCVCDHK